jgi:hypothetical protein
MDSVVAPAAVAAKRSNPHMGSILTKEVLLLRIAAIVRINTHAAKLPAKIV